MNEGIFGDELIALDLKNKFKIEFLHLPSLKILG